MQVSGPQERLKLIVATILLCGLVVAAIALWVTGYLTLIAREIMDIFQDREHLRNYVVSWGGWAPAAFIVVQALQVVLAPIPGELTGAVGGFIFGALPTILYSSIGLTVGSIVNFVAAKIIGLPFVKLMVSKESMEKFHFLTERRGTVLAFVLFVIPGFPKDILSYILGLSPMTFVPFVIACAIGRIPGTVMLSFSGSAVYDEDWTLLTVISVACLVTLALAYYWRAKIDLWLRGESRDPT